MSDELPPTDEPRPLAAFLFGWAFKPRARSLVLIVLGAVGLSLVAEELIFGRPTFGMPFEDTPVFYALLGFGGVTVTLAVAHLWRLIFARLPGSAT